MAEPVAFKYRAFISYSHADTGAAKWLHRGLESFPIDKELVGRETATGAIPKSLKPVFRDRDDFTAGHALTEQTLAALDASHALIVICSPAAAASRYVNEEVRLFKSRHPERPVIPLIVGGKPGDAELECFPPALKCKLDSKGRITKKPAEVLAADAREEGDGKTLALAKVVAGLLDVSSDDVYRRAERERRRKGRARNGIIAVLAMLAVAASGSAVYAWQQLKTNQAFLSATLKTATEIVDTAVAQAEKYGVPRTATLALLTKAEGLFDNMARLDRPTAELRYQKSWMLIQFARNYAVLGDSRKRLERARAARDLLAQLVADQPDNLQFKASFANANAEVGFALESHGKLAAALKSYETSLAIGTELVKAEPEDADWQMFVAAGHGRIGEVQMEQADLTGALKSFDARHAILLKLGAADPKAARDQQREFAVSHARIGEVLMRQGDLKGALQSYKASLVIMRRLAKAQPASAAAQNDLAAALEKAGHVLKAQGDLAGALKIYEATLTIFSRLAKADPGNAQAQRGLVVAYGHIGKAHLARRDLAAALESYKKALAIISRLAKADPENTDWRHDLFAIHHDIARVLASQGKVAAALENELTSLALIEQLSRSNSNNAYWQRELGVAQFYGGKLLADQGDLASAVDRYRAARPIFERLAKADPTNAERQYDLAVSHGYVGSVLARQGEVRSALDELRQGRDILSRLKAQSPDSATFANDLAWFDGEIAKLEPGSASGPAAQPDQAAQEFMHPAQ